MRINGKNYRFGVKSCYCGKKDEQIAFVKPVFFIAKNTKKYDAFPPDPFPRPPQDAMGADHQFVQR